MPEADTFKKDLLAILPSLRAFAVSLCGNSERADDLVQDALLKAWAGQAGFTRGTNLKAWIFTILRNEFYSKMRKSGREVEDREGYFTLNAAVPPSQFGTLDLQDFAKALNTLPEDQREALLLVGASGFSYEEAARICNCKPGTVKSRVSRARSHLQGMLEVDAKTDYGPDGPSASTAYRSFVA